MIPLPPRKKLTNGSNEDDYESSGEDKNDGKGPGNEVGQESDTIPGLGPVQ